MSSSDEVAEEICLNPFVYWAQDEVSIFLKADVKNVQSPQVEIQEDSVDFLAYGEGSRGANYYKFRLNFVGQIDVQASSYRATETAIEFTLKKASEVEGKRWWPRLVSRKPAWLKLDFEKWDDPDITASSSEDEMGLKGMGMKTAKTPADFEEMMAEQKMMEQMENAIGIDEAVEKALDYRNLYLFTYNLALFLGYFFIVIELLYGYISHGSDYYPRVWTSVGPKIKCCIIGQFFEVFHAYAGFTKTNLGAALVQCGGRLFIVFVILSSDERMQDKPFVFFVFITWSFIELFRYPYYALAVQRLEWSAVTWLRYNMWIPLYPLGFLCEGTIVFRSIIYFRETGKYSLTLPNALNISIDFASLLTYGLLLFIPIVGYLLGHMRTQRKNKMKKQRLEMAKKRS